MEEIVNKVAESGIEQIDLKMFLPKHEVAGIDLKNQLWQELVLREKDFRLWVKEHDWSQYQNKIVAVYCSSDAIIPAWAFMLVVSSLKNIADVFCVTPDKIEEEYFFKKLSGWDVNYLADKKVMVKGCSDIPNPSKAYVEFTKKLMPVVTSLMFGEPCSAVPVYKRKSLKPE